MNGKKIYCLTEYGIAKEDILCWALINIMAQSVYSVDFDNNPSFIQTASPTKLAENMGADASSTVSAALTDASTVKKTFTRYILSADLVIS